MKVTQIIKICKDLARLDLPQNCFEGEYDDYTVSETAKTLLVCCNFVLEEIYCNYATALRKAVVTSVNGVIDTTTLELCKVVSLTDSCGNQISYRYTERGLYVDLDGTYNLVYAKIPQQLEWRSQFVLPTPRITPRIFALGVVAEYYSTIGDDTLAEKFRARFLECVRIATRKQSPMKLPVGRWW